MPLEAPENHLRQPPDSPKSVLFAMLVSHYALKRFSRGIQYPLIPLVYNHPSITLIYRFLILHHLPLHPHPPRHPFPPNRRPQNIFSPALIPSVSTTPNLSLPIHPVPLPLLISFPQTTSAKTSFSPSHHTPHIHSSTFAALHPPKQTLTPPSRRRTMSHKAVAIISTTPPPISTQTSNILKPHIPDNTESVIPQPKNLPSLNLPLLMLICICRIIQFPLEPIARWKCRRGIGRVKVNVTSEYSSAHTSSCTRHEVNKSAT